jgi:hypothetical protein
MIFKVQEIDVRIPEIYFFTNRVQNARVIHTVTLYCSENDTHINLKFSDQNDEGLQKYRKAYFENKDIIVDIKI